MHNQQKERGISERQFSSCKNLNSPQKMPLCFQRLWEWDLWAYPLIRWSSEVPWIGRTGSGCHCWEGGRYRAVSSLISSPRQWGLKHTASDPAIKGKVTVWITESFIKYFEGEEKQSHTKEVWKICIVAYIVSIHPQLCQVRINKSWMKLCKRTLQLAKYPTQSVAAKNLSALS